jgi:hypothetical protein
MSNQAVELLNAFEALPPGEKQGFATEVLRRTPDLPFDSGPVSDEEIGEAGRSSFALLDDEQNASAQSCCLFLFAGRSLSYPLHYCRGSVKDLRMPAALDAHKDRYRTPTVMEGTAL